MLLQLVVFLPHAFPRQLKLMLVDRIFSRG